MLAGETLTLKGDTSVSDWKLCYGAGNFRCMDSTDGRGFSVRQDGIYLVLVLWYMPMKFEQKPSIEYGTITTTVPVQNFLDNRVLIFKRQ